MSEENKIGTYQFVAEPFHVDFNGRLTFFIHLPVFRQSPSAETVRTGFWLIPTGRTGGLPSSAGPDNLYSRTSYNTPVVSTFVFSEVTASFRTNARSG